MAGWYRQSSTTWPVYLDYQETIGLFKNGKLRVRPEREGECFRLAYLATAKGFGDFLIGTARSKDTDRIYHAVAESKNGRLYYDGTLGACFDVSLYQRLFGWLLVYRMSPGAARRFVRRTGMYPNPMTLGFPPLTQAEDEIRAAVMQR
jgi:hypothetical protein